MIMVRVHNLNATNMAAMDQVANAAATMLGPVSSWGRSDGEGPGGGPPGVVLFIGVDLAFVVESPSRSPALPPAQPFNVLFLPTSERLGGEPKGATNRRRVP